MNSTIPVSNTNVSGEQEYGTRAVQDGIQMRESRIGDQNRSLRDMQPLKALLSFFIGQFWPVSYGAFFRRQFPARFPLRLMHYGQYSFFIGIAIVAGWPRTVNFI